MERDLERQMDFRYIGEITKKDIELDIDPRIFEEYESLLESVENGDIKFGELTAMQKEMFVSSLYEADLVVRPINDYINELIKEETKKIEEEAKNNDERKSNYTISSEATNKIHELALKEILEGKNYLKPTKDDIIEIYGDIRRVSFRRLANKISLEKKIGKMPLKDRFDFKTRHSMILNAKGILSEDVKQICDFIFNQKPTINEHILLMNYFKSLSCDERKYLLPNTYGELTELEYRYTIGAFRPIRGFANLNEEFLDELAEYIGDKKCLEICAGDGLLSSCLQDRKINIIPTDISEIENNYYDAIRTKESYTDVLVKDGVDAVKEIDADILIMSWPPYNSPIAYDAMVAFFEKNPNGEIIYIGEYDGCTADASFFEYIEENELKMIPITNYEGDIFLNDMVYSIRK